MNKAIIHTDSRVIKRMTTDDVPSVASDETAIDVDFNDGTFNGFFAKLDGQNKKVAATASDIDLAGVDEEKVSARRKQRIDTLNAIIEDISTNGATLTKIRSYFQALKGIK